MTPRPIKLYESTIPSGNAYKILLLAHHLELELEVERLNILSEPAETRGLEFLAKNPNGRIPVLELSNGSFLCESNAILCFLAAGTPLLPKEPLAHARALQWLFFEQYSHERFIAVMKFWKFYGGGLDRCEPRDVDNWQSQGQAALGVMERHLAEHDLFTGSSFGVSDIALYAYTHTAQATGFDLSELGHVCDWLQRVANQPRHIPLWS